MIDPLCGPCNDEGRMVKAHYMTNPPMCREHYQQRKASPAGGPSQILQRLAELRESSRGSMRKRAPISAAEMATPFTKCQPCMEGGEVKRATHRMNGMDMCATHANAAAIEDGPPAAIEPEDVEIKETKPKGEKRMAVEPDRIAEIRKLAKEGKSVNQIATELSLSLPTVRKYMNGNTPVERKKMGRPRKTDRKPTTETADKGTDDLLILLRMRREDLNKTAAALDSAIRALEGI